MEDAPAAEPRLDGRAIRRFAVPMAALTILGWVGDALTPTLLAEHPLWLLSLNPRLRNLVLVSPSVAAAPFFAVAVVRALLSDPLFFVFGRRYGDTAIRWMERRLGGAAKPVLFLERLFRRASYPMVAIAPNNVICLLSGATGMSWGVFLALNFGGTALRVALIRLLGDAFADPIVSFTDWIADNRRWLTAVTVSIVLVTIWRSRRTGRSELETPSELEHELEEAAHPPRFGVDRSE